MTRWRAILVGAAATLPMLLLCMCAPSSSAETPAAPAPASPPPGASGGGIGGQVVSSPSPDGLLTPPRLQARVRDFLARVRQHPDAVAAANLDSLAGDVALGRLVTQLPPEIRRDALRRTLQHFITTNFVVQKHRYTLRPGAELPFRTEMAADESLSDVAQNVAALGGQLADGPLERRLREVLAQPGAAEALLTLGDSSAASASAGDSAMPPDIATFFQRGADGKLQIAESQRDAATRHLEQLRPVLAAARDATERLAALAQRMQADSQPARRFQAALRDPLLANLMTLKLIEAGVSPPDIPQAAEREAAKALQEQGGRLRLADPNAPQLNEVLGTIEQLSSRAAQHRSELTALSKRIDGNDPLHAGYRELLSSDLAVLTGTVRSMQGGAAGGGGAGEAVRQTALGDMLVQRGAKTGITRWRRGAAADLLDRLERTVRDGELIRADLDDFLSKLDTPQLLQTLQNPMGRWRLVTALSEATDARADLRFDAWADAHFDAGQALPGDELRRLAQEAKGIERQLSAEERPLVVDLEPAAFSTGPVSLFRSSVFYNPRTPLSRQIYLGEFARHRAARLWGPFEWDALESSDFDSFLRGLHSRRGEIEQLVRTHDKLMVILAFTPSWLSRSNDSRSVEGHWQYRNAVRPRDWGTWERMVAETVKFFTQFDGVQWYFEVWNEPDLPYWQEGSEEYLELYRHTAAVVKRTAPGAKVGGSGVNHWQGKPSASRSREPLNVDLIRFAAKQSLPLDFVSWHVFNNDEREVDQAVQRYRAVIGEARLKGQPELLVTEWNIATAKGTERASGAFAERMLTFHRNGIGEEFFSAWEEFNLSTPADDEVGPWGMITQRGRKKPEFYVFKLFDRLAREQGGVAIARSSDDMLRAVVSRTAGGELNLLVWETGYAPGLMEAIETLQKHGVSPQSFDAYQTFAALEQAVRTATPLERSHTKAFEQARAVYQGRARPNLIHLTFPGVSGIEVLDAKQVVMKPEPCELVFARGNALVAQVPRMTVLSLQLRVKR